MIRRFGCSFESSSDKAPLNLQRDGLEGTDRVLSNPATAYQIKGSNIKNHFNRL